MVISPCINVCKMEDGLCTGCFRRLDEIARWASAVDEDKRLILAAVAQRRARLDPKQASPATAPTHEPKNLATETWRGRERR